MSTQYGKIIGSGYLIIPFRTVIAFKIKYLVKNPPEGQFSICTTLSKLPMDTNGQLR